MAFKTPDPIIKKSLGSYNFDLIDRVENDPMINDDDLLVEILRQHADGLDIPTDDDSLLEMWTGRKKNPTEPGPDASWTWKDWIGYNG